MLTLILRSRPHTWALPWITGLTGLAGLAGLAACSVETTRIGPEPAQLRSLVDDHCDRVSECSCAAELVEDGCTDTLTERWEGRRSTAEQLGLTYDAECWQALTAQIQDYECYWPGGPSPLCSSFCAVFHGDRELGRSCEAYDTQASDCAQGLVCADGSCVEPCAVLNGRLEGETCGTVELGPFDDCAPGLSCNWQSNLCEPLAGPGASCFDRECAPGLACDWQADSCEPAAAEGQSCAERQCGEGLYCDYDGQQERCRPYAQQGEPCEGAPCDDALWCSDDSVCVTEPREGEPCLWGNRCAAGYVCDEGLGACITPPDAGSPCIQGQCNTGAWCDGTGQDGDPGICVVAQPTGQACAGHRQCVSGYCPNGFCWERPQADESCEGAGVCAPGLVCNGLTCEATSSRAPAACSYAGW